MFKTAEAFGLYINGVDEDEESRIYDLFARIAEKDYYGFSSFPTLEKLEVEVIEEGNDIHGAGDYYTDGEHYWIIRHNPSGSYWKLTASFDSWKDDNCMGEGGDFYEVKPVEKTVIVYEKVEG